MNLSKIVKNVSIVSILAGVCAPIAIGCASPTDVETPAKADENVAVTSEALTLGPMDAVEVMGKALATFALGKAASALFPEKGIDVKQLLADLDAQTRQAIMDEAMRQDKGSVDAALTKLHDIELQKAHIGEPQHKTAKQLYDETRDSSTMNGIDTVVSKLGPSADEFKYKRDGLKLYIAAVQIDASRLALEAQLDPDTSGSAKLVMTDHLRAAITHVRETVKVGRQNEFNSRLGLITACTAWYNQDQGEWFSYYKDNASGAVWGHNSSYVRQVAMGRCDADRDGHHGRVEAALASQLDAKFGWAIERADEWTQIVDALDKVEERNGHVTRGLHFGGMYGYGSSPQGTITHANPFTGGASCPAGYDAVPFAGAYNIDWPAFACFKKSNGFGEPVADFGGMFSILDYLEGHPAANNPLTGGQSCPEGFAAHKVLGGDGADNDLTYCARAHVAGTNVDSDKLGGLFNRSGGYDNTLSEGKSCSNGYTPTQIWGSNGVDGRRVDQAVVLCTKK